MTIIDKLDLVVASDHRGGALLREEGVEFAVYSRNATSVVLCLFDETGAKELKRYELYQHDDNIWRGLLPGAKAGLNYGYRVDGPYDPERGHRFNSNKLLVDPFARALTGKVINSPALFGYQPGGPAGDLGFSTTDSAPFVPKGVVLAPSSAYPDEKRPGTPMADSIIYELHVKGFSKRCLDLPEGLRGTFEGLSSELMLRHMVDLGITAVELLPIHPFNDEPHLWAHGLSNYWGYNSYNFFAPDPRFGNPAQFRKLVGKFHEAGIEVLLDVVYNHSGEGDEWGPTLSLRGIDNATFYRLNQEHPRAYVNDTGCGNTLDCEQPYVLEMILSSMRYWAGEMGVDGFRFDLAPVLARARDGFKRSSPFFSQIDEDPLLSRLKLIAEPWDVGPGGYRLGDFPLRWSEWNDKYRDAVRAFWRGDDSLVGELAARITGSKSTFGRGGRRPQAGVNYIAVHDGFTLHDVVSYGQKHNEANRENNRDGQNDNYSKNYGVEGESDDPALRALRDRQLRNMLATLMLSQGVPMLQAGDELGRTQNGNNNAYCQDNELSWIDWANADWKLTKFVSRLIALRQHYPQLRLHGFLSGRSELKGEVADIVWLSPEGHPMKEEDWALPYARCFGVYLAGIDDSETGGCPPLLVMMNAHYSAINFRLPPPSYANGWRCVLNTDPEDDCSQTVNANTVLPLGGYSLVVLESADGMSSKPIDHYDIRDLCEQVGIEESYEDLSGQVHHLDDESARQLLSNFGFDASTDGLIDSGVRQIIRGQWQNWLPAVMTRRKSEEGDKQQATFNIALRLPSGLMSKKLVWTLCLETGETLSGAPDLTALPLSASAKVGRARFNELQLRLSNHLPLGYHDLTVRVGEQEQTMRLVIAPAHCYRPEWMDDGQRVWGIAHQLYSLHSQDDWGIGDLGDLNNLIFAARKAGADVVGLNPLHSLFPLQPGRASPYSPSSRLWLNVLFIDLRRIDGYEVCCKKLISEHSSQPSSVEQVINYDEVAKQKLDLLKKLYSYFLKQDPDTEYEAFQRFLWERGEMLEKFCCYSALQAHFKGKPIEEWPTAYRDPSSAKVKDFKDKHRKEIDFYAWLQWQADRQLACADDLCREVGMKVGLYGDLAVGVAADGADCWVDPQSYVNGLSFGAPPDAFNSDGQNWCMPPMNPIRLRETAFRPFIDMLRQNMRHYGALRLDHVMWLKRMFVIPSGLPALAGAYVRFPFEDLLAVLALESNRMQCLIVGEDLGTVPLGFRERMALESILSYRIMRFERHFDGSFKTSDEYPYLSLATPSSHDLPPLLGYLEGHDIIIKRLIGMIKDVDELKEVLDDRIEEYRALVASMSKEGVIAPDAEWEDFLGNEGRQKFADALQVFLSRVQSALLMLNLEDLAASKEQVNIPGTVFEVPNWRHRLDFDLSKLGTDERLHNLFEAVNKARGQGSGTIM